jgi:hypothetical protein
MRQTLLGDPTLWSGLFFTADSRYRSNTGRVDSMSEFDQAVQHERMRLMGLISEAKERIAELEGQVASDQLRIEALDAYDRVKVGRASGGKGPKKATRRAKSPTLVESPGEPTEE